MWPWLGNNSLLYPVLCFTLETYKKCVCIIQIDVFDWILKLHVLTSHELTFAESTFLFRLTKSDFREPVNIGSDEMVSMNEMAEIVLSFENKQLPIHHIPGPEGVRGRNSDNTLIKEKLGWAPTMKLKVLIEQ